MEKKAIVVPAQPENFEDWCTLYRGYAKFYKVPMNEKILNTTWSWIMDEDHEVEGLLAFLEGEDKACGLAHVRAMPRPLGGNQIGFLDDLFVAPESRGHRVGEALFYALGELAKERGWPKIRWITADDNYRARVLYDNLSKKTLWNTYELEID
ncbi:GNAT family N-acetyltransferase [Pseudomonadota bacterium]